MMGSGAIDNQVDILESRLAVKGVELAALRAKAALFDALAARIEAGAWVICDTVGGVKILLERTGERVFDVTLAGAIEKAMEAEGETK